MLRIETDNLNLNEVNKLIEFIKELKQVDYSVVIESIKGTEAFKIEFNEV